MNTSFENKVRVAERGSGGASLEDYRSLVQRASTMV